MKDLDTRKGDMSEVASLEHEHELEREHRARSARRFMVGVRAASTVLIAVVSLLIAFTAVLGSHYVEVNDKEQAVAAQINIDSIRTSQEQYAIHDQDVAIWSQITAAGDNLETSPLAPLLSQRWKDAVQRQLAANTTGMPTDDEYWDEVNADATATAFEVNQTYGRAQEAATRASQLTIVSVIFTAAVLILSLCSITPALNARVTLLLAAIGLIIVAIVLELLAIA